ncbi:DUF397 domain-containing protein [Kitasatospora sp. NPDC058190]
MAKAFGPTDAPRRFHGEEPQKDPEGPRLRFTPAVGQSFVTAVRDGGSGS